MKICNKKAVVLTPEQEEEIRIQSYFDRITPSVLRFYPDYYKNLSTVATYIIPQGFFSLLQRFF